MRLAHIVPIALAAGALATSPEPKLLPQEEAELLKRGLVEDILEDIKDGFSCAGCEVGSLPILGTRAARLTCMCRLSSSFSRVSRRLAMTPSWAPSRASASWHR